MNISNLWVPPEICSIIQNMIDSRLHYEKSKKLRLHIKKIGKFYEGQLRYVNHRKEFDNFDELREKEVTLIKYMNIELRRSDIDMFRNYLEYLQVEII